MFYLYIVYSKIADLYYVGSSGDPFSRLEQHNTTSLNTFTSKHRPWILVSIFEAGNTRSEAEVIERFIKKQKSRSLILKLKSRKCN